MLSDDEERTLRRLAGRASELTTLLSRQEDLIALAYERRQLDALVNDARMKGSPALLRRLYVLAGSGMETIANNDQALITVEEVPINANADTIHFFYLPPSVYIADKTVSVASQTGVVLTTSSAISAGIHCSIVKQRPTTGDDRVITYLQLSNNTGAEQDVYWKVYRHAGLT